MDYSFIMSILNCSQKLENYASYNFLAQTIAFTHVIKEFATLAVVCYDVVFSFIFMKLINFEYVWMIHRFQQFNFIKKCFLLLFCST